jgi:protein-tyrosine phosphatase
MAERLARKILLERLGDAARTTVVASAGTHAIRGSDMHPLATKVLGELDVDATGFRSRALALDDVASADLVLTAERAHRVRCAELAPSRVTRCFTIRQFGRLARAVDPSTLPTTDPVPRAHALLEEVLALRGTVPLVSRTEDDLPDPVAQPLDAFRACAAELSHVLGTMADLITGDRRADRTPSR